MRRAPGRLHVISAVPGRAVPPDLPGCRSWRLPRCCSHMAVGTVRASDLAGPNSSGGRAARGQPTVALVILSARVGVPGPESSGRAAGRPAMAISSASPCPSTVRPSPVVQSRSVAASRSPRTCLGAPMGGAPGANRSAACARSSGTSRGRASARRTPWWWMSPSVSAIWPPKRAVSPLGRRCSRRRVSRSSGPYAAYAATPMAHRHLPDLRRR
jgi:hypothetical protein